MKSNEYYPSSYTGPLPRLQPSERIDLIRKTKEEEEEKLGYQSYNTYLEKNAEVRLL
jgi:hypothetical protein